MIFSSYIIRRNLFTFVKGSSLYKHISKKCTKQFELLDYFSHNNFVNGVSFKNRKLIGTWLLVCSGITFSTVVIGGVTRLTRSGLSMVNWHLFKEFPPLNQNAWENEFEKYKQYPEYKLANIDMTLNEFKKIWHIEYAHRTLGRAIGLIFSIPAIYFWRKNLFNKSMKQRTLLLGSLILAQGLLGWYMVKSGLNEEVAKKYFHPSVSHYRLAAHLGTAFVLYYLLLSTGLTYILPPLPSSITPQLIRFRKLVSSMKGLIFVTVISGAMVAGLEAGLIYNSWPKMGDKWIPDEIVSKKPIWSNISENLATVQFDHRILGELVFLLSSCLWLYSRKLPLNNRSRLAINIMMSMATLQFALGIATLLFYVPKNLASAHQAGALSLYSAAIWASHELKFIKHLPK